MTAPRTTWRQRARHEIEVIHSEMLTSASYEMRRTALRAYPWGERKGHAYKAWRHECRNYLFPYKARRATK